MRDGVCSGSGNVSNLISASSRIDMSRVCINERKELGTFLFFSSPFLLAPVIERLCIPGVRGV